MKIATVETRFWRHVLKTDSCWLWTGARTANGYGVMRFLEKKNRLAHRVSWEIHRGLIPMGMDCCHHCDVRNCVRPDHLFVGTRKDNMADCVAKLRHTYGDKNGRRKLSEEQVSKIRRLYFEDEWTTNKLAMEFGVSFSAIRLIVTGVNWKHSFQKTF